MLIGTGNFSEGITTNKRVGTGGPVLAVCDGYDPSSGALIPENIEETLSTTPLAGTIAEQTPVAFRKEGVMTVIALDADGKLREFDGSAWAAAGDAELTLIDGSVPVRMGDQVIYPTLDALMAYEPGSPTTKLRPLSMKSPADYEETPRPLVTQTTFPGLQLFDCEDANVWTAAGTGTSVDNAGTDVAVLTLDEDTVADQLSFTKSLGATGVDPTGKLYLVLDVMINNDEQLYANTGLFVNDSTMFPSGYELVLYSDTSCTTAIATMPIPRCDLGYVHRFAFRLPGSLVTVKGVGVRTASYFIAPATDKEYTITVYSEDAEDDWSHKGNLLLPAVVNPSSALGQALGLMDTAQVYVPPSGNLLTNAGFETGGSGDATGWDTNNLDPPAKKYVERTAAYGVHGGSWAMRMSIIGSVTVPYMEQSVSVDASSRYELKYWGKKRVSGAWSRHKVEIIPDVGDTIPLPETGDRYGTNAWTQYTMSFLVPSSATSVTVRIYGWDMVIDDVSLTFMDRSSSGSAYQLQKFTPDGENRTPASMFMRYAYAFLGQDLLGSPFYKHMVSNPSDASVPDAYADPWRENTVEITVPTEATTDYGDYLTHVLVYKQVFDGATDTWDTWTFMQAFPVEASISFTDTGNYDTPVVNSLSVPEEMEITNDAASVARHAVVSDGRVYAGCLDWDTDDEKWNRPMQIQVSTWGKPWAFPTTQENDFEGTELGDYAATGGELTGLAVKNDEKIVFLDSEFYLLRGEGPWQFTRIDGVGCDSARTIADCRGVLVWMYGGELWGYIAGKAQPVSRFRIDGDLIDLTAPHNAVFCKDTYMLYCEYDGEPSLLKLNVGTGAWRIRTLPESYVGICTDGLEVFGVTAGGHVASLVSGTGSATRRVHTQYIITAPPGVDAHIKDMVAEVVTATEETLGVTCRTHGMNVKHQTASISATSGETRHDPNLNLKADAISIEIEHTGASAPELHYIGVNAGDDGTIR